MGTLVSITLYAQSEEQAQAGFVAAFKAVAEVDRRFTDYDRASELSQICTGTAPLSKEMRQVLSYAQHVAEETSGAFDITVGPITHAWRKGVWPEPALRSAVGYRKLHIGADQRCDRADVQLDAGGIAKGFAGDKALEALQSVGVDKALIAVSGDLRIGAPPPLAQGWRVDIAGKTETLHHCAVSTSGDDFQHREHNGKRYSHIIDPRSGEPLANAGVVSVIAKTGMEADALATAANVLGPRASAANKLLSEATLVWH